MRTLRRRPRLTADQRLTVAVAETVDAALSEILLQPLLRQAVIAHLIAERLLEQHTIGPKARA